MKSLDELAKIRDEVRDKSETHEGEDKRKIRIIVNMGSCGMAAGARETMTALLQELAKRKLNGVMVTQTGCLGLCEQEPLVEVAIPGRPRIMYGKVSAEIARQIVADHIVNGSIISSRLIAGRYKKDF